MKKLSFYLIIIFLVASCNSTKQVTEGKQLLTKNTVFVDNKKNPDPAIKDYIIQRPNSKSLGLPLSLYFYNLGNPKGSKDTKEWAKKNHKTYTFFKNIFSEKQSIGVAKSFIGINNWFLSSGEAPVIINDTKTKRTIENLKIYFQNEGYFKAKISAKKDTIGKKKGAISYFITRGNALFLDKISKNIRSAVLDSIYIANKKYTYLKSGDQYKDLNFEKEANRLNKLYRNNGIYHFDINSIDFEVDTLQNSLNGNVALTIKNRTIGEDGNYNAKPYEIQKIKNINVFTDYNYNLKDKQIKDSVSFEGINYIAYKKLKYNPKYLSQSLFLHPNDIYSDSLRSLTRLHLRGLKNFKSTSIKYRELSDNDLEANIYLTPIEKYTLGFETELSRSNIRNFDISGKFSILNRNTFRGAEIFKLSFSGSYFNSNNGPGWEIGSDLSLEVPRFMAPFGLNKLVPKQMFPRTKFSTGIAIQKNIGLDKQNINIGVNYKWQYNKRKSIQLELVNAQYIRNLNVDNYFNIYRSEYRKLEDVAIAYGTTLPENSPNNNSQIVSFIKQVNTDNGFQNTNPTEYQSNANILNRYQIISSDFLIPVIAYTFTYKNQSNFKDQDFSFFRIRVANSGNIMGVLSNQTNSDNKKTVLKIPVAQYFKTDIEYKKFWKTNESSVLGFRAFTGAIFSYGDSNIPFSKSYFAGGSNDIRAWRTYDLGPGTTQQGLEYNIGSLKFLTTLEYRFDLIGNFKSALFIDAGNIWDISNNSIEDSSSKFNGFSSLKDLAVGTGFGLRYDFKFLVARLDLGFKAHEPYLNGNKWFQNFGFGSAVYNIGINYPF